MLVVISQTLFFFHWFIQLLAIVIIKSSYKILSLTHRKCQSKPNIWILPSLLLKNKYGRSELYRDQIFSLTICLYNRKFDWLLIVDPIWLVWHTYISHWSTDPLIHPPITYPTRRLRGIFFTKNNSKIGKSANWWRIFILLINEWAFSMQIKIIYLATFGMIFHDFVFRRYEWSNVEFCWNKRPFTL